MIEAFFARARGMLGELGFLSLMKRSIPIAINRSTLPVGSSLVLMLVGHYDLHLLAALTLLLATSSIFFVLSSSGQIGLQVEFSRLSNLELIADFKGLLFASLLVFGGIGLILCIALSFYIFYFSHFLSDVERMANSAIPVLAISIPLVACATVLTMALEANGGASIAAKIRLTQMGGQLVAVMLAIIINGGIVAIAWAYVLSDAIGLIALTFTSHSRGFLTISNMGIVSIDKALTPFKVGSPIILGQLAQKYGFYILTLLVSTLGAAVTDVLSTVNTVVFFAQIILIGICQAISIDVAKALESHMDYSKLLRQGCLNVFIITILLSALLLVGAPLFGRTLTANSITIAVFCENITSVILFFCASNILVFLMSILRAFRDFLFPQLLLAIVMAVVFVAWAQQVEIKKFSDVFEIYVLLAWMSAFLLGWRLYFIFLRTSRERVVLVKSGAE